MALQLRFVESIFARLVVRYGASWGRQWEGVDPAVVKADWCNELAGLSSEAIKHALANLPIDRPPNVGQFRALCINRPVPVAFELSPPQASAVVVAAVVARLSKPKNSDPKGWACCLREREERGERLTKAQRDAWRAVVATEVAPR